MLLLNSDRSLTVDGVTVFPDHADPNHFWYLPGPVSLATRADGRAAFTMIKYKPSAAAGGAKGGGFAMFTTSLRLPPRTEQKIKSQLSALTHGTPTLELAQFDRGTVECVALNLQGPGGTTAQAAPAGAFNAVATILGAQTPSMQGDENAVFSLVLTQEGATILEQAYRQGAAPIGVIYNLTFTGLRPNLHVKITADFNRVYNGLSASLAGQYYFFQAGIDAAFEKLKQDGVIKIDVIDFTGEDDKGEKEKWALDFFKDDLLAKWFEPTLTVGQPAVTTASASGIPLPTLPGFGQPGATPAPTPGPTAAPGATPAPGATTGPTAAPGTPAPGATPAPTPTAAPAPTPAPTRPAAALHVTARDPNPSPTGYDIQHTPAPTGTTETLRFPGGSTPPQVKVDGGDFQTLGGDRQLTLEVQPGTSHTVIARWNTPASTDAFELYFSYEKPHEQGFSTASTNPLYRSYMLGSVSDDPIYSHNHRVGSAAANQAQALQAWIQALPVGANGRRTVDADAHASWEGDDSKGVSNSNLSSRRLEVARGLLRQSDPQIVLGNGGVFLGHQEARTANRVSQPRDNADGSPNTDRVVRIHPSAAAGAQTVSITATIDRGAIPPTPTPGPTPTPRPTPSPTPGPTPTPTSTPTPTPTPTRPPGSTPPPTQPPAPQVAGNPVVAFRLKFVHQEEMKTLTFEYNRQDATQRTYAPQGFFDVMLGNLADRDKTFVEVDLDDPFFRTLAIDASLPIDFVRIGLDSVHTAIDYGDPADPQNHRTHDFVFSPRDPGDKHAEFFLNQRLDMTYRHTTDFNFDPQSDWNADAFSYHIGPLETGDRNLFLNPYDHLAFLEVTIFPHDVDAAVVDSIDVEVQPVKPDLTPAGPAKTFHVLPDSPEQFYRFRSADRSVASYRYQCTTRLKDGTTRVSDPRIGQASLLPVNDPFDDALVIECVPLYDSTTTRTVFVDIEYDDVPNDYHRRERLTFEGDDQRKSVRLALMDKKARSFRYRLTFVGTGNQIRAGAFHETTETILAVAPEG